MTELTRSKHACASLGRVVGVTMAARTVRLLLLAAVLAAVAPAGAAAATQRAKGIDVSHWNGVIDWIRVAGSGYTFVFGKATEGFTLVDPTYSVNRAGTEGFGLKFGAYHFARPSGTTDAAATASAIAQADHFVDVAEPAAGELPPVLDLEAKGGLNPARLLLWTKAWLDEVDARTGVQALIYASPNFWTTALGNSSDFAAAGHGLWIAHWTSKAAPLVPAANWDGKGWTFWQWTNCSTVPGFAHCPDGDRMNGTQPSSVAIPPYPTGPPAVGTPPGIVGAAVAGKALAAVPGAWTGGKPVSFTYQWQSCDAAGANCVPVDGATAEKYVPSAADVGHSILVTVTATSAQGVVAAASSPTAAVAAAGTTPATRPAVLTPPEIAGTAQAGQTLTAGAGTWSGSPGSFTYQWQRCDGAGANCVAITGATFGSYTPTPGDIGSTISLVVSATGRGGTASSTTPATAAVAAAPLPAAVPGSLTAQPGQAGAVQTEDGRATVTWQPGAVPDGLTAILAPFTGTLSIPGTEVALGVADLPPGGFPWPVDIAYATPQAAGTVLGWSTDSTIYAAVPALPSPSLPSTNTIGSYTGSDGLLHVLTRVPVRLALFQAGRWGDPSRSSVTGPTLVQQSAVHLKKRPDKTVLVLAQLTLPSQAHLYASVFVAKGSTRLAILKHGSRLGPWLQGASTKTAQTLMLKPGAVPVRMRLRQKALRPGARYRLRVVAIDPWGRRDVLVVPFQAP
jgi:GH25 family lysozyme M1 (1,4-beta-N-acetylmuramidase)